MWRICEEFEEGIGGGMMHPYLAAGAFFVSGFLFGWLLAMRTFRREFKRYGGKA